jgi:RimJ/RimL family protein N-acetyltransferase
VLFERADRSFIGWAGLDPTAAKKYELGYRLLRVHWGKGLATEASTRLVRSPSPSRRPSGSGRKPWL